MTNQLKQLEDWVAPLLAKLTPQERRKLARKLATPLARSQRDRIRTQRNPDGSSFEGRKPPREPVNKPVRFLYRKPGGSEREAAMKSYRNEGDRMTGYDSEAGGIRTFLKARIKQFLTPKPGGGAGSLRSRSGSIRRKAMFSKIRQAKYLKTTATDSRVLVGFAGEVARIARVHQYGLHDKVGRSGKTARYPKRELLGLTDADQQLILDGLVDHLTSN